MEARMKATTAAKTNTGRRKEQTQKQEERRQDQTHRHEKIVYQPRLNTHTFSAYFKHQHGCS